MPAAEDVAYSGLADQVELVRRGEVSSRELTNLSIDRIVQLDPKLNAFRVVLAKQPLGPDGHPAGIIAAFRYAQRPARYP